MTGTSRLYPKWYNCIEEPVREVVYSLRNAGFNTTNSCGHDMWIQIDLSHDEVERLYNWLATHWGRFTIEYLWENDELNRSWAMVRLGTRLEQ